MRPVIDEIRQAGDFATVFRWNLFFIKLPVIGAFGAIASPGLNIRCESTEQPKVTGQKITANIRGNQVHQPGIYNYSGTLTVTFIETVDSFVANFIKAWREAVWKTKVGSRAPSEDVKGQILMTRLNSDDKGIWAMKINGVFIDDYDFGTLDGATSDALKPTITFSYDDFEDAPTFGLSPI